MIPEYIKKINDEVYIATSPIVTLGVEHVTFLRNQASSNTRQRARICAHKNTEDSVHEMLIAITNSSYIPPHKHHGKSESFHIVDGVVDIVVFGESGEIKDVIELGDRSSGKPFYYRLLSGVFHTLIIHTQMLIVHEITSGPFLPDDTTLAPFAPAEEQRTEVKSYMERLKAQAKSFSDTLYNIREDTN